MNDKCEHCRFWKQTPPVGGTCQRLSPQPSTSVKSSHVVWAHWPRTSRDDGCGEFKPSAKHTASMEQKFQDELKGKLSP